NAKLQFVWNNLNIREQQVTQEIRHRICEQHDCLLLLIEALSRTDPTTAARILLKRVDIAAENIGDLLKVYPCKKTEKEESIFDAPPLPDISEERLQWALGMIEKNHQAWEQSAEEKGKSMVDSVRDDAEEIIEAASEAIEKSSVTLAKELEDIASHWRWMTVVAIAVALAIGCAAAIFLCPQYVLCFMRYCLVWCRHKE
ncbi:hypothetical protein Tcan_00032, partial [Toxocara canis]